MNFLAELSNNAIFHYAIIFCRLGSIMLFIPGFGETYVSVRARLVLALFICLALFPLISPILPAMPADILTIFLILAGEVTIGIFLGLIIRIIQGTLHIAGMKIAFMTGLSSATIFDTNQSTQGSMIGGFLSIVGITIFFTADFHHIVLRGIFDSYNTFQVSQMPPFADFAEEGGKLLSGCFLVAFKIAAPIIIVGTLLYIAAGLMGRLMPTMQVFFVLMPIQIYVGFLFVGMAISGVFIVYMNFFYDKLMEIF